MVTSFIRTFRSLEHFSMGVSVRSHNSAFRFVSLLVIPIFSANDFEMITSSQPLSSNILHGKLPVSCITFLVNVSSDCLDVSLLFLDGENVHTLHVLWFSWFTLLQLLCFVFLSFLFVQRFCVFFWNCFYFSVFGYFARFRRCAVLMRRNC